MELRAHSVKGVKPARLGGDLEEQFVAWSLSCDHQEE